MKTLVKGSADRDFEQRASIKQDMKFKFLPKLDYQLEAIGAIVDIFVT